MASYLIYKIQFIQNNPFGTFVSGDVLDVYIDTDTIALWPAGVTVNKNGVLLGSGPLIDTTPAIATVNTYSQIICNSTSLVEISQLSIYPYGFYNQVPNHYACALNPPVCDLFLSGVPNVIGASAELTGDGSIEITATSTNTIEYKIGSDFIYGDGTGQATGLFENLYPGTYRIFIRDSVNCSKSVEVTVPVSFDYGPVFRLEYDDINGWRTKVDLTKRSYVGAVTDVCGGDVPFELSLRGEGSQDKFEAILSSEATLNLLSDTEGKYQELYTNDPNLYRIEYYKDTGSGYELKWVGKVLPQIYQEQYRLKSIVSIRATDSLPELNDFYLIQEDRQTYYGTIKLIKLLSFCLSWTRLNLNITVACNLYATTMDQTAADDPFDQAYCDFEAFYLKDRNPDLLFVLRSILEPFGCKIVQWGQSWWIIRVEECIDSFDYRVFDSNGDYVSNGTFDPIVDINYPSLNDAVAFSDYDQNLEIRPGYGLVKVNYRLGLKPNVLKNGDFRLTTQYFPQEDTFTAQINKDGWQLVSPDYVLSEGYEFTERNAVVGSGGNVAYVISAGEQLLYNTAAGTAYIQSDAYFIKMGTNNGLKFSFRYKILKPSVAFNGVGLSVDVPYIKFRVRVKYGSNYLLSDGNWSSSENILEFLVTEFNKYTESEIVASQPLSGSPSLGDYLDIRIYHAYAWYAQFDSLTNLRAFDTYDSGGAQQLIPTGYKTELRDDYTPPTSHIYYYELEENTDAESGYAIVRPDDYNAGTNPRQWILKKKLSVGGIDGTNTFTMALDRAAMTFLTDGNDPYDFILRSVQAEGNNRSILEKELILGSNGNIIVTEANFGLGNFGFAIGSGFTSEGGGITIVTTNAISYETIYAGWLRDSSGVGYESWARDGVTESDKLHGIWLRQYAAQYNRSWRLLRGSFKAMSTFFGLINVAREVNDNNRIYLPIALTLNDLRCTYNVELLELNNSVTAAGSDGSGEAPFSSGFSSGFGAASFN